MSGADPAGSDAGSPGPPPADEIPFMDRLRRCIEERRQGAPSLAVLLVDCGLVGQVDTQWGYPVGDAVRSRIAASLRAEVLRPGDFIGELGREDIACVLTTVDGPEIALLAAEKSLRALNAPLWVGEDEVYPSPSIGISMWPAQADSAEQVLQRARSACVTARNLTSRIALYEEERDSRPPRLLQESRLRSAVSEDTLEMAFQPQVELRSGLIMGIEAMLRWPDGDRKLVAMRDAFAAAEAGGSASELISSVLNRGLRNCSEFRYRAGLDLRLALNLPTRTLLQAEFPDLFERALRTWNLRAGRVVFELEGVSALAAHSSARETIGRLREMGVKLSIDDPSAPLSSLFWLATMPFQELKIDLSAAREGMGDPKSERILQSLIELAHHLKLEVVALAVENEAAASRLAELGCDYMQADYWSPPLSPDDFVARFAS